MPDSSIVTTMARNGTTYGIRLAGDSETWHIAASPPVQDALYYPGQGPDTSAPDIGDSAVLELVGLGGAAAANSPAVAGFLGGRMADAAAVTAAMSRICAGTSTRLRLPVLDNAGTPLGVDVRRRGRELDNPCGQHRDRPHLRRLRPGRRRITTRHEQATTYMADGYARVSGRPGVALVVPGVGLYNAAAGLATAYSRSSPVLVIAGQIPRGQIGRNLGGVHEIVDQPDVVRPVTKWRQRALRPREIPWTVSEAFRQMRTGRPRPALIEIPPEASVEREEVQLRDPAPVVRIVPDAERLREAAGVIAASRLPLIYAGGGVARSDAEDALVALAEATNIPVITSGGGKGTIPDRHPLSYGSCVSPEGERFEMNQLYDVMRSADVVIGIGARFSMGNPAGESSVLVNINIDDTELTRIQANTVPLHGDATSCPLL